MSTSGVTVGPGPAQRLSVDVAQSGPGAVTCILRGDLDLHTREVAEAVVGAALAGGPELLRLDLAQVAFCDSSGLNLLLTLRGRAADQGARLVLAQPSARVLRLLELTDALSVFTLE